jgi:hypothetical protein
LKRRARSKSVISALRTTHNWRGFLTAFQEHTRGKLKAGFTYAGRALLDREGAAMELPKDVLLLVRHGPPYGSTSKGLHYSAEKATGRHHLPLTVQEIIMNWRVRSELCTRCHVLAAYAPPLITSNWPRHSLSRILTLENVFLYVESTVKSSENQTFSGNQLSNGDGRYRFRSQYNIGSADTAEWITE